MYPIDAAQERMEAVEVFGVPGLFTTLRVNRATIPKGIYAYDMQTSEEDWSQPCLIARHITVEHYGTVITASPIELPETGYRDMEPGDFSQATRAEQLTIAEFKRKHLSPKPHPLKPKRRPSAPAR